MCVTNGTNHQYRRDTPQIPKTNYGSDTIKDVHYNGTSHQYKRGTLQILKTNYGSDTSKDVHYKWDKSPIQARHTANTKD